MLNILIVDGLNRSGLAVARALKIAAGYTIHATAPSAGFRNVFIKRLHSNSIDEIHLTENEFHATSFINEITKIVVKNRIDAVIPVGQAAAVAISRSKPELGRACRILIEDYEKLILFHDKGLTSTILKNLKIPHPLTALPRNPDELTDMAARATYPAVIKAKKGMGSTGVAYASGREELQILYKDYLKRARHDDGLINDNSYPLIQEYIPGELHDALVFCVDGEVKTGLTQKRLVTRPSSGGIGVVNITTSDDRLIECAQKIARHTNWNGVLMLDFKIDSRDAQPKLLEVNPRFWGTTWLSICAGINFPHYLVSTAFSKPFSYVQEYQVGLTCRWIVDEFAGIFDSPRTFSTAKEKMKEFLKRFNGKNCIYDVIPSDIKPMISDILNVRIRRP